ncbi:hypothetical protein H5410_062552 [Solanum commersonii]|uniref:Uncharacterized protein n=1 Tax=Solanum commersonii TaxID=4109 RepID=A0A9J5WB47_SOLCO|nr:hypothetical protein H5410_062552 [Solanum commersonii]
MHYKKKIEEMKYQVVIIMNTTLENDDNDKILTFKMTLTPSWYQCIGFCGYMEALLSIEWFSKKRRDRDMWEYNPIRFCTRET